MWKSLSRALIINAFLMSLTFIRYVNSCKRYVMLDISDRIKEMVMSFVLVVLFTLLMAFIMRNTAELFLCKMVDFYGKFNYIGDVRSVNVSRPFI